MAWTTPHTFTVSEVVTAATMNLGTADSAFLYGDTAWTAVTYTNGWVDYGLGYLTVQFRKLGTRVAMQGTMKAGTLATAAFTLPVGYRPLGSANFAVVSNGAFGVIVVNAGGAVIPTGASTLSYGVDGITFDTI